MINYIQSLLPALPASFVAGLLWDIFNSKAPFYFSLALTVLAIFALFFVKEDSKLDTK